MDVKVTTENGRVPVSVVAVTGNVDTNSFEKFLSQAEELMESGAEHILVDLSAVPYMSSAGLRVLNLMFNRLRSKYSDMTEEAVLQAVNAGTYKSPNLKLFNLSEQTKFAFETAGFDMYIETFTDRKSAIDSF
jgi:anti-anti-sigma factor